MCHDIPKFDDIWRSERGALVLSADPSVVIPSVADNPGFIPPDAAETVWMHLGFSPASETTPGYQDFEYSNAPRKTSDRTSNPIYKPIGLVRIADIRTQYKQWRAKPDADDFDFD